MMERPKYNPEKEPLPKYMFRLDNYIDKIEVGITRLQKKYDENGYDSPPLIKLQRIEQHIDSAFAYIIKKLDNE